MRNLLAQRIVNHIQFLETDINEEAVDFRCDLEVTIEMMEQLADIDSSSEVTTCCQLLCDCLELLSEKMNAQHTIINLETCSTNGRPSYFIPRQFLEYWLAHGFTVFQMSTLLCVSQSTVKRRLRIFDLKVGDTYSDLSNEELGNIVKELIQNFPSCGYRSIRAHLLSKGIKVQEYKIRNLMKELDPEAVLFRRLCCVKTTNRRKYSVRAPQVDLTK